MTIRLPRVPVPIPQSLTQTLSERRSHRQFSGAAIDPQQLAQLLWAAQGPTNSDGQCVAPSAGAQYPMEIVVVAGCVSDIDAGVYRYRANTNALEMERLGDMRDSLYAAALDEQPWVKNAAVILALVGDLAAMQAHFQEQPPTGKRGERYLYLEAGAMAQNVALQVTALGLGAVLVGGFDDEAVCTVLNLDQNQRATALLCIGSK